MWTVSTKNILSSLESTSVKPGIKESGWSIMNFTYFSPVEVRTFHLWRLGFCNELQAPWGLYKPKTRLCITGSRLTISPLQQLFQNLVDSNRHSYVNMHVNDGHASVCVCFFFSAFLALVIHLKSMIHLKSIGFEDICSKQFFHVKNNILLLCTLFWTQPFIHHPEGSFFQTSSWLAYYSFLCFSDQDTRLPLPSLHHCCLSRICISSPGQLFCWPCCRTQSFRSLNCDWWRAQLHGFRALFCLRLTYESMVHW